MESRQKLERAFVAGATGLTGRFVVQHLTALGVSTVAHIRPDSSRLQHWSEVFTRQGAQVSTAEWDAASMIREMKAVQPTVVFGLLGTTKARTRGGDGDYEAVDFGLTACLIDACVPLEERPKFVYLSAVGVKPDSSSAYYKARAQAEDKLKRSELPALVARPSFILGERDDARPGERIGAPILDGLLGGLGLLGAKRFTARYRSMTGEELAAGLAELALAGSSDDVVHVPELRAAGQRLLHRIASRDEQP